MRVKKIKLEHKDYQKYLKNSFAIKDTTVFGAPYLSKGVLRLFPTFTDFLFRCKLCTDSTHQG